MRRGNAMSGRANGPSRMQPAIDAGWSIARWGFAFSGAVTLLYLAPSLFMMQVYDRVLVSSSVTTLLFLGAALAVALLTLVFIDSLRQRLLARISLRFERMLAPLLLNATLSERLRGEGQDARHVVREFDVLRQSISGPAAIALFDIVWSPIYFIVCFMVHPALGGLVLLGASLLLLLAWLNDRALRKAMDEITDKAPQIHTAQDAESAAAEAVRALGMRPALIERQLERRETLTNLQTLALFRSVRNTAVVKFLRLFLQSTILGMGAFLAINGEITPGALIAASILGGRALQPIEQVVSAWRNIKQMLKAIASVRRVLETEDDERDVMALPAPRGELRFERVHVRMPGEQKWLLADINFVVKPGEIVGVIGPSGAGKSTLARVAVGALSADSGVVRIDGASFAEWDANELGAHIGYLPQDLSLLAGTVAENISRFSKAAGENADAATVAAAQAARAHEMIQRLPAGYNTRLEAYGRGVSVGQAQRIALARALYRGPNLIVMDEPNAHLDAEGEAGLIAAMREARARGAAILVVAHRAGVLASADRLIVLNKGRVDAFGPREDVMRKLAERRNVQAKNQAQAQGAVVSGAKPQEAQS